VVSTRADRASQPERGALWLADWTRMDAADLGMGDLGIRHDLQLSLGRQSRENTHVQIEQSSDTSEE
jgi:hypothetical protein